MSRWLTVQTAPLPRIARVRVLEIPAGQDTNASLHPSAVIFDSALAGSDVRAKKEIGIDLDACSAACRMRSR